MTPEERTLVAVLFIFVAANCACHMHSRRLKREWAEMHRPLNADSADLRLDAALRAAQDGTIVCPGCGFDNFQRSIFCSICGQVVGTLTKKQRRAMGDHVGTGDQRRQLRARLRKEWTRKIDVEGRIYWFREALGTGSTTLGPMRQCQRGFIVRFLDRDDDIPTTSISEPVPASSATPSLSPDATAAPHIVTIEQNSPAQTTADLVAVVEELTAELERRPLTVDDAAEADPSRFAIAKTSSSAIKDPIVANRELRHLIDHAKQDFPTKLAVFVTRALGQLTADGAEAITHLHIHRQTVVAESLSALATLSPLHARAPMRVQFIGEQGIDAGGVYREWFVLLNEQIVRPDVGIFTCVDTADQTYYLNPQSRRILGEHHLAHVLAAGRLVGRALLEGNVTGFHLSLPLLKLILGLPVTFDDLEFYDREMHRSLRWLLEHDGVEALGLDFTVCEEEMEGEDENENKWEKEDDDKGGDAVEDDNAAGNADVGPGVNHGPAPSGASGFDGHFGDGDGAGGAFAAVGSRMRRRRRHRMRVVELIPNGHDVAVTDANKHEYVERKLRYVLFERVSRQLFAFLRGVHDVVPPELFVLFDAEELDYVLSGSDEIDVDDWERHTKYTPDLWNHPTRQWFWELVREMPNEYRRRLLQFATGASRVPLAGFAALTIYDGRLCPFTLVGLPLVDEGFVRSHACFNRLDLPRHVNKAHLRRGLYAVLDTELYGFSMA